MANTAQARKRARQAEKRRAHNGSQRSSMRTAMKKVLKAISGGDNDGAKTAYQNATALVDKAAGKGLIHANKAARIKSRLNASIRKMA